MTSVGSGSDRYLDRVVEYLGRGGPPDALLDGQSLLHDAAYRGRVDIAEKLLERGANVNVELKGGAFTPLHMAAGLGHYQFVEYLLEHGAQYHYPISSSYRLPIVIAFEGGHTEIANLLATKYIADNRFGNFPTLIYRNNLKNRFLTVSAYHRILPRLHRSTYSS